MAAILTNVFSGGFIPQGECNFWQPEWVWLGIVTSLAIALAHYSIFFLLIYFKNTRRDIPVPWIFWIFAVFIFSTGTSHLGEVWALWHPIGWLPGGVKVALSVVSGCAAGALVALIPQAGIWRWLAKAELLIKEKTEIKPAIIAEEKIRFQANILSQVSDAVVALDNEQRIIYWNAAAERLYHFISDEVLGKKIEEVYQHCWLNPEDELAAIEALVKTGSWRGELIHRKKIGEEIRVESSVSLLADEMGKSTGFLSVIRDVSDRARAETALQQLNQELETRIQQRTAEVRQANRLLLIKMIERQQADEALNEIEERFRTSIENMLDCFGLFTAIRDEFGKIIDFSIDYVNQATCAINQLTKEEQIGQRLCELLPANRETGLFDEYCQVVETGKALVKESIFVEEIKGGQHIIRAFDIRAVKLGDGFAAAWRDITARKQAEAALYRREGEFKALVENAPDIIARFDRQMRHLYVNPVVEQKTGIPASSFIGKTNRDLGMPEKLIEEWDRRMGEVFQTGVEQFIEFEFPRANGESIWHQSRLVPEFTPEGALESVLAITRDVTESKRAEQALKESEEKYRRIIETATEGIWMVDAEGKTTFANQKIAEMLGYPVEEMIGMPLANFTDSEWLAIAKRNLQRRSEGIGEQHDFKLRRKDGSELWVIISSNPIFDAEGKYIGALGMLTDITQRKRAQEERDRFFNLSQNLLCIAGFDGYFKQVNPAFEKTLGWTVREIKAKPFIEFVHPDEREATMAEMQKIAHNIEIAPFENRYLCKDGSYKWLMWKTTPLPELQVNYAVASDITERKLSEMALRESATRLRLALNAAGMAAWDWNLLTNKVSWSEGVESIFGVGAATLAESYETYLNCIHPEDRPFYIQLLDKALETGSDFDHEYRILRPDGAVRWVAVRGEIWRDANGKAVRTIGIVMDITERKQALESLRESEERFRQMAENSEHIFTIRSLKDRRMLYISPAYEKIFGRSCLSLYEQPHSWQEAIHPEDREFLSRAMESVYAGDYYFQNEYRIIRPDGAIRWIWARTFPIQNEAGEIYRLVGIAEDITDRKLAEESLRQSEQHLRSVIENMPVMMNALDDGGNFIVWNRECERVTGYSASEIVGNPKAFELLYPDTQYRDAKLATFQGRQLNYRNWEWQLTAKDGSIKTVAWSTICEEFPIPGWASWGIGVDLTERKQAEAAQSQLIASLQESEERFRAIAEATPIPVLITRIFDGKILYANAAQCAMLELPPEVLGTLPIVDFYYDPAERQIVLDMLERDGFVRDREIRVKKADGTPFWISISVQPLTFNGERAKLAVSYDISDRKRRETQQQEELQQFKQIIARVPVAMALLDKEMRYLAHSEKWLVDYNCQGQSIIGKSHYELLPDVPHKWKEIHQRALAGEVLSADEDFWERADGSKIYERWAIQPWHANDGEIGGILLVTLQINELVEAREAALAAVRFKSEFLANMSHEIRTPMNGVLGMVGLLLKTQLTPQQFDYAKTIRASADHLLTVIDDILDFSKLEAGEMQLETLDFDLNDCLEEVVNLLAAQAETKGLELAILIDSDVPKELQGDAGRLRQILLNLVGNGIKFTDAGEVVVQVSCLRQSRSRVTIRFAIRDTGIGIAPEHQKKLFQSFSQVDASMTRRYGGTGLGLAICKQLVQVMGGEIGVESQLDRGSTFWFTLKFSRQKTPTSSPTLPLNLKALKLLVADESATTRQSVRLMVSAWGMHVDEAASLGEALSIVRSRASEANPYDVAIIELSLLLKEENSYAKADLFSEVSSLIAPTKLISIASLKQREFAERLIENAIQGYVVKPVRASRLFNSLLSAIAPICPPSFESDRSDSPSPQPPLPNRHSLRILLVEDHPINQQVILEQLSLLGYQADCVDNGQAALDRLALRDYDIVLMDCQMPVLDGYEATRELRRREGDGRHTVVVALTAHSMRGDRDKCLAVGMDDYISKPVDFEELNLVLERWQGEARRGERSDAQSLDTVAASPHLPLSPSSSPPLDMERLNKISRGKIEFQKKLLRAFIDVSRSDIDAIRIAVETADYEAIEQQAHRLKGAAANVGANSTSALAAQLELNAREKVGVNAAELLIDLTTQLTLVQDFIENLLSH